MSLLWERTREHFQKDLQNPKQLIQATKNAIQLLNEIQEEKGLPFLQAWINREGDFPLIYEYIKYYKWHIPYGPVHQNGTLRVEAILAQSLLQRMKELTTRTSEEVRGFILMMGHGFLLD